VKVRNTVPADKDIHKVLTDSFRLFGLNQSQRYLEIVRIAIDSVARDPLRVSSKARDDIGPGVRSLHLQFAAKRQGGASHVLYYRVLSSELGTSELVVLRLLADRMDPNRRVRTALKSDTNH
jgi:toxin ParE1/3/4